MPTYKVTDPQTGRTLRLTGDSPPTEQELTEVFSQFKDAPRDTPRTAQDAVEALLTNLPTKGFGQDIVRGLPATAGGMAGGIAGAAMGAPFGPLGMAVGGVLGAGLGGASGEAVRQATAQGTAAAFPEANYPILRPGQVAGQVGIQGAVNAAGQAIGVGAGAAYNALRPGAIRGAATTMKVLGGVPENSGVYALDDVTRLGRAPSQEAVSGLYDDFHRASGTVSRKEAIKRSPDPFDSTARAIGSMRDASNKLRAGTLTVQEAVEASQAGRIIRDMKSRGVEMAQEVAAQADELKGQFDDFIARGMGPRTEMRSIPIAEGVEQTSTPIASRLEPKTDIFEGARTLVPEQVNVPTSGSQDLTQDLRRVVDMVNRAKGQGMNPKSIMTESERALYDQFRQAVESSAEYNVPIETLLTGAERSVPTGGFAERTVLRPGEPIYQGQNRLAFGGTIEKPAITPTGEQVMGEWPVHVPAKAGFPEWQAARQGAFERAVADDFGSFFPRNVNGSPNRLSTWSAMGGGATTGMAAGALLAGPAGAVVGGGLGAVGGAMSVSPLAYGAAIRAAGAASRAAGAVPAGVYRVLPRATAGGVGSALEQAYLQRSR